MGYVVERPDPLAKAPVVVKYLNAADGKIAIFACSTAKSANIGKNRLVLNGFFPGPCNTFDIVGVNYFDNIVNAFNFSAAHFAKPIEKLGSHASFVDGPRKQRRCFDQRS